MSTGKKGKKKKCKTVDLMSFLADGGSVPTIPLKSSSWADDIEDEHEGFSSRSSKEPVILPTAPRAARGSAIDLETVPTNPPYVAYISNLPYDIDEDDLAEFFAEMKVSNIRLPKDSNKFRGYGYVEFEDRQSLIDALSMVDTTIKTRRMRIDVSTSSSDDRRGGRMGRDNRRDNYDDPERTSGDWRSGPREDMSSSDDHFRGRYDNSDRRDHRENSDYDNKPGAWRERDNSDRSRTSFRDRGGFRDSEDKDRDWGRDRYDRGSRDRDGDRGSFGPRRNYGGDREGGDRERDWSRRPPAPLSDAKQEPRTRPKLQLQPRTKPIEPIVVKEEAEVSPAEEGSSEKPPPSSSETTQPEKPTPVPAANIFGAAKPVDTAAREREIEGRLARTYADSKPKTETEPDKRPYKEGAWGRRNGEGREDKDRERSRPTWRSDEERGRRIERSAPRNQPPRNPAEQQGDSAARSGPPTSKPAQRPSEARGQSDSRERKEKHKDVEVSRMPKAKDEQAPNFVASNKYSMLPDDVDSDEIDD